MWLSRLRIQHYHCSSLGCCCGAGPFSGPGTCYVTFLRFYKITDFSFVIIHIYKKCSVRRGVVFVFMVYIPKAFHVKRQCLLRCSEDTHDRLVSVQLEKAESNFRVCQNLPGMCQNLYFGKLELVYFHNK